MLEIVASTKDLPEILASTGALPCDLAAVRKADGNPAHLRCCSGSALMANSD